MAIENDILDFLRDANYRVGELGTEIRNAKYSRDIDDLHETRMELLAFMTILYRGDLHDSKTNFITWPDKEILTEIHRLRAKAKLNEIGYMEWTNFQPVITIHQGFGSSGGGSSLPNGTPGQIVTYNSGNNPVATDVDLIGGFPSSSTLDDIFG